MLMRSGSLAKPNPLLAFDWGSQSIRSVLTSAAANDEARLMAVVVLPTPPFWLTTASTLEGASAAGLETAFEVADSVGTVVLGSLSGACSDGKVPSLCRRAQSCGESCGQALDTVNPAGMALGQCGNLL